ncbi:Tll0287-like domain-containing protein [Candidatus Rariloculus sp.]|uniref:Tll0287-like domain-containing protein n=1 Tax=Candidatus Rariloculus sp. TaxID=3101265 RepID=UPI003D0ECE37
MKRKPLLVLWLLVTVPAAAQDDERLTLSRDAAAQLGQELTATLLAALGTDGAVEAIRVCSIEASPIAARISEQAGAGVGRTALRLRNPDNAPDADARTVLTMFERDLAAGAPAPPQQFDTRADGSARFMSAIVTQPLCLTCHGSEIAPEVAAEIARHYPEDQATGFTAGDLRGAFLIEWPAPDE